MSKREEYRSTFVRLFTDEEQPRQQSYIQRLAASMQDQGSLPSIVQDLFSQRRLQPAKKVRTA